MDHAQASQVKISIEDKGEQIYLSIADDGTGFDADQQKQKQGLTNMREPAASINARLTIHTAPGCGTRIEVVIAK